MKILAKTIKTTTDEGLPARLIVGVRKDGTVEIVQRFFTLNPMNSGHFIVKKKWKGAYLCERLVCLKKESFGHMIGMVFVLVKEMGLSDGLKKL